MRLQTLPDAYAGHVLTIFYGNWMRHAVCSHPAPIRCSSRQPAHPTHRACSKAGHTCRSDALRNQCPHPPCFTLSTHLARVPSRVVHHKTDQGMCYDMQTFPA